MNTVIDSDRWSLLIPFGDAYNTARPYSAEAARASGLLVGTDGRVQTIQRCSPESLRRVKEHFDSSQKVNHWRVGIPIYDGHPDRDLPKGVTLPSGQVGLIKELELRREGLFALPVFNDTGANLLKTVKPLYMSARFNGEPTGTAKGLPVYEPTELLSVGLTQNPNLATDLLNAAAQGGVPFIRAVNFHRTNGMSKGQALTAAVRESPAAHAAWLNAGQYPPL